MTPAIPLPQPTDRQALIAALEEAERAERIADLVKVAAVFKLADQAYLRLVSVAIGCGYQWSSQVTCLEWARKEVLEGIPEPANRVGQDDSPSPRSDGGRDAA